MPIRFRVHAFNEIVYLVGDLVWVSLSFLAILQLRVGGHVSTGVLRRVLRQKILIAARPSAGGVKRRSVSGSHWNENRLGLACLF